MFCEKCGYKLENNSRFCESCGAKLQGGIVQTQSATVEDNKVLLTVKRDFVLGYKIWGVLGINILVLVFVLPIFIPMMFIEAGFVRNDSSWNFVSYVYYFGTYYDIRKKAI